MGVAPLLSAGQRAAGTCQSRRLRQARADAKKALARGYVTIEDVLRMPEMRQVRLVDVLRQLPAVGPARAARLVADAGISPTRRVGGVGRRQRVRLLAALRGP